MAELEASGVATGVICTTPFCRAAQLQWEALGFVQGSVIEVDHPLGSMSPDRVLEQAERVVESVLARLTASGNQ